MSKGRRFNFSKKKDFSNEDSKKVKIGILSENVMSYYRNVSTSLENGFDDDPEMKGKSLRRRSCVLESSRYHSL